MDINWTMSVYRTPGLVPGTWQDSPAGASAVSFPSGCRVGICGLKLHHGGWSGSSFFLSRLWSEVSFPRFWGNHALLPSLKSISTPQAMRWWFSILTPFSSAKLFFYDPLTCGTSPKRGFLWPGPRLRDTEGRQSRQSPVGAGHSVHEWRPDVWDRQVCGSGIWQIISLFFFRKSKATPEKIEFMGMQQGEVILNLHNQLV